MQGYGKEADLWSVGVIMFLLLCGKLPFDGDDHNEIIRCVNGRYVTTPFKSPIDSFTHLPNPHCRVGPRFRQS